MQHLDLAQQEYSSSHSMYTYQYRDSTEADARTHA